MAENFNLETNDEYDNFNLETNDEYDNFEVEFGEVTRISEGTSDFNALNNRPKYNDAVMSGETNIPEVPTKTSDLSNDSGYQTSTEVQNAITTAIAGKQNQLTAGSNVTIENNVISATDTTYTGGTGISIQNGVISLSLTSAESESF